MANGIASSTPNNAAHLVTANSSLGDWQSFTPTTQGIGTPTINYAKYRRVGDTLHGQVNLTTGTVTADEFQLGLPSGLVIAADYSLTSVGNSNRNSTNDRHFFSLATAGDIFLNMGQRDSTTTDSYTARNGNALFSSATAIHVNFEVKIVGWSSDIAFTGAIPTNYANVNPNILINGDMRIEQRGLLPKTGVNNAEYYSDRWHTSIDTVTGDASLVTTSQPSSLSGSSSLKHTATSSGTGKLGTLQKVEDYALYKSKTITISAWVKSNATSANLSIHDGVSYISFSVNHSGSGEWEYLTATGTVSSSATQLLGIYRLASSTGGNVAISSTDENSSGAAAYIEFTGAKLELGSSATAFVPDSYGDSLRKCQRYYEILSFSGNTAGSGLFAAYSATGCEGSFSFTVPKYGSPSVSLVNAPSSLKGNGGAPTYSSSSFSSVANTSFRWTLVTSGTAMNSNYLYTLLGHASGTLLIIESEL